MDIDAELKVARLRAVALANARVDAMQRDLRRAGAEDRRIIRQAAGLPEPLNLFTAVIEALGRALSGQSRYALRVRHGLMFDAPRGIRSDFTLAR